MADMPVQDQVVVMVVHTKAEVVLATVRTAARIWWAILKEMAPKAASSLSSQTATSWAVTGGGPGPTVGHGIVLFTILQRFWLCSQNFI